MLLHSKTPILVLGTALLAACSATLTAAPKLRLTTATVGPVSVAQGQNGPAQVVDAFNAGDGDLSLQLTSSVTWLRASIGSQHACSTGVCTPIQIALNTSSLEVGTQTGLITVADPNAVDAPQTITVTVQVGGGVPNQVSFLLPPNNIEVRRRITTSTTFTTQVTQPSNGPRLTVIAEGAGTFRAVYAYDVVAVAPPGTADGNYTGSIRVSNSSLATDNKTIQVAMQVTRDPIATPSQTEAAFRLGAGVAAQTQYLVMSNSGLGTLQVTGATATTASGGNWLSSMVTGNFVGLTANPEGVAPGSYRGEVKVATNGVNGEVTIPVTLDVIALSPPVSSAGGVVSNATFQVSSLAQGDLPAIFGQMFTKSAPVGASSLPLPKSLGGTTVFVNDQPAPIFYTSYGQVNFQIPFDTPPGEALLRVDRDGERGNAVSIRIAERNPRILVAVNAQGEAVTAGTGGPYAPVRPGDTLVVYCLGFGQTNAPVESGTASPLSPLATISPVPRVAFGGSIFNPPAFADPFFVGLAPNFVGLYQVNVTIPANVQRGPTIPMLIQGTYSSNTVLLNIP